MPDITDRGQLTPQVRGRPGPDNPGPDHPGRNLPVLVRPGWDGLERDGLERDGLEQDVLEQTDPGLAGPGQAGLAAGRLALVRTEFERLTADPRLPQWLRRGAAAAVVGIVLGLAADWRLGIAGAALTGAAGMLYGVRTSAVVPASARAAPARRRTARRLARMAASGYLTLPGRVIPSPRPAGEHPAAADLAAPFTAESLVVCPAGIYMVESVHWDRRLPVRATRGKRLCHGPFDETAGLDHLARQAQRATRQLREALGWPVAVRPVLVIYGPPLPWPAMAIAGVDVLPGQKVRRYLRRESGGKRALRLSERQIEIIHAVAAQIFPPAH
jgi:hypothetical protein